MKNFAASVIFFMLAASAVAQVPAPGRGSAERPALPEFLKEPALPRFILPPAPEPRDRSAAILLKTVITRFRITGSTVWPAAELEQMLGRYTGRPIGSEELEEARLALTQRYVAAGYINSGAVIPDQEVRDGTMEIRVIEGRLAEITVAGENRFREGFIRERVALAAGPPLNVLRLQERMQVLLQNPQIERINAELAPGLRPGEAVLRLDVAEAKRQSIGVTVANNRSPAVGADRVEAQLGWRNAFGLGESLGLRFGVTEGLEDLTVNLAVPVTARDTLLTLKLERTDARVVEKPFELIDVANRSRSFEIGLAQPVVRTVSREVVLSATLARRDNASFLLGQPFSFTPGLADGKSVVTALRLSGDWSERSADEVLAARLSVSRGLDRFGATLNPGFPDSRFVTRLAQLQWARRLGAQRGQLIVRADWQRANGALLPSEKFAVGGAQSVRGYRENALVRDNGWVLSIEHRQPIGRLQVADFGAGPEDGQLELALFADAGKARDDRDAARRLSSWGLGLRWTPAPGMLAQLYKGFALQKLENPTRTPSDRGIHFLVALQAAF